MSPPFNPKDLYRLAAALRDYHMKAQRLLRMIEQLEYQADELNQELSALAQLLCTALENQASTRPAEAVDLPAPDSAFLQQLAANGGVERVHIEWLANGKASVSINGGSTFLLPKSLGHLLQILCEDTGVSDDRFVVWKSRDHVESELRKRSGKPSSRQTVHARLTRLRDKLTEQGENRHLILTQRDRGIRFAVRRIN